MTNLYVREVAQYSIDEDHQIYRWDVLISDYNGDQHQLCFHAARPPREWHCPGVLAAERQRAARTLFYAADAHGSHATLTHRLQLPPTVPSHFIEVPVT